MMPIRMAQSDESFAWLYGQHGHGLDFKRSADCTQQSGVEGIDILLLLKLGEERK